jgi:peptidoglycan/xylan/chitin deacetylase (PgdA/CDA1 family)
VFCGESCARKFAETGEAGAADVSTKLLWMDQGLTEEIHEYGEQVHDQVKGEFDRLEGELDQALTALATMVEGSAVAASAELEKDHEEVKRALTAAERKALERTTGILGTQEKLQELLLTSRALILELREQVEHFRAQVDKNDELLAHRVAFVEKQQDGQTQTLKENARRAEEALEKHSESFAERLRELLGGLDEQVREIRETEKRISGLSDDQKSLSGQVSSFQADQDRQTEKIEERLRLDTAEHGKQIERIEERLRMDTAEHGKTLEALSAGIEGLLSKFSAEVNQSLSKELKRVVDDMAMFAVAQKGNWNEIIRAANTGAEKAVSATRDQVTQKLTSEVELLARTQAKEIGRALYEVEKELKKKIQSDAPKWPKRLAYAAAGLVLGVGLAFPVVTYMVGRGKPAGGEGGANLALEAVQERLSEIDSKLRSLMAEKPASSAKTAEDLIPVPAMTRGNTARKEIAFTFDAGSNAGAAVEILDTLKARNIHTTMFLTGKFMDDFPDVVRRIASDGHEVGNHLLDHVDVVNPKTRVAVYSKADFLRQLSEVEKRFENLAGARMSRLWRAPYGEINDNVVHWAASMGYRHVGWTRGNHRNLDSLDWVADPKMSLYRSAEQVARNIFEFEKSDPNGLNGAVILMHLGTERRSDFPHKKLPELLDALKSKGYAFVTVSEVLRTDVAKK